MSTLIAILLVVTVSGMLLAYQLGYSNGRREGFDEGRRTGKREGSVRAFAVGYDRGRHNREAKQKEDEQAEAPAKPGCRLLAIGVAIPWLGAMLTILGSLVAWIGGFHTP